MTAKIWPGFSVAIILVLAFLLLRECKVKPAPEPDKDRLLARGYDSAKRTDSPVIVRLTRLGDSLQSVSSALQAQLAIAKQDLQQRGRQLTTTLAALDQSKAAGDTAARLRHGDTLEAEVKAGIPAVEGYSHLSDSLIHNCIAENMVKDSVIGLLSRRLYLADTTITAQQLAYKIVHKDDDKKTAQLRFYKPVAVGGVVVIALTVLFKIIAH
jgi:hypothetical protein